MWIAAQWKQISRSTVCAALALILLAPVSAIAQESARKQIAARIELHPIQTLTLSDQKFLTGDSKVGIQALGELPGFGPVRIP